MPIIPIIYGRPSRRRQERGAPGKQIVLQCGEMGGACKEVYETPKRLSRLLIAKGNQRYKRNPPCTKKVQDSHGLYAARQYHSLLLLSSYVFNGHHSVASTAYMQRLNFRVSFYDFPNSHSKGHAMEKSSCAGGMASSSFLRG